MTQDKQDQFDQWVDQWDDAQKKGIFDEPEKSNSKSPKKVGSFFGLQQEPLPDASAHDAEYWDKVYELSNDYGSPVSDLDDDPHADHLEGDLIQEDVKVDAKDMAGAMRNSPNPIRPASMGKDQELDNPVSIGATYDVGDLEELEKVKLKLHSLIDKLNGLEANGQANGKLEQQIATLSKQIDEMSDNLNRNLPNQQGD